MAGDRLENWFTLPRDELRRRVDIELSRANLKFVEQQLLEAAQERLLSWREPRRNSKETKMSDDTTTTPEATASAKPEKETKVKSKRKSTPKKAATKAKTKAVKKAASKGNGASRIPAEAKITKTNKENPFREGSESHKRVETVFKNSGKTAGAIMKLAGLKNSTLATCKRLGLIKVEA